MHDSDIDDFLKTIDDIKLKIELLLEKSALEEEEKRYILDHVVVIPGQVNNGK